MPFAISTIKRNAGNGVDPPFVTSDDVTPATLSVVGVAEDAQLRLDATVFARSSDGFESAQFNFSLKARRAVGGSVEILGTSGNPTSSVSTAGAGTWAASISASAESVDVNVMGEGAYWVMVADGRVSTYSEPEPPPEE